MKTDLNYKMMPLVPTSLLTMSSSNSKPKIGFSIDSIVGGNRMASKLPINFSSISNDSQSMNERHSPFIDKFNDSGAHLQICIQQTLMRASAEDRRIPGQDLSANKLIYHSPSRDTIASNFSNQSESPSPPSSYSSITAVTMQSKRCVSPQNLVQMPHLSTRELQVIPSTSPPQPIRQQHADINATTMRSRSPSPLSVSRPILVPGIPANLVRPLPVVGTTANDIKSLPPYSDLVTPHPNPHFLAAQFQMAAALAHGQAGQGYPPAAAMAAQHPAHPGMLREGYPLYPWLLSRHGRIFPHRFPGSKLHHFSPHKNFDLIFLKNSKRNQSKRKSRALISYQNLHVDFYIL